MRHQIIFLSCLFWGISITISAQEQSFEKSIPKWRFSLSGGMGYSFVKGSSENSAYLNADKIKKYEDDVRWTTQLNSDAHYFLKPGLGLGVKYLLSKASASGNDFIEDTGDGRHYVVGDISENVFLNYVGLSVAGYQKLGTDKRFMLYSAVSLGYAHYRDEIKHINYNYLISAGTIASTYEFGIEYFLKPTISIGANLGMLWANFYSIKLTDGSQTATTKLNSDTRLNASNVNLSLGIRYYLNK